MEEEVQEVSAEAAVEEQEPVVETEPAVEEPVEVSDVEEPPAPKKKETAQEMANRLTKARREAEREREYWKRIALEKEKEDKQFEKPVIENRDEPPRPTLDQYDTTTEYEDALFEWRDKVKEIKETKVRVQTEQEKALESFNKRALKVRDEYPDFDEVIERPVFSPIMRSVLLKSENGPEIAYYLGLPENQDTADRIRNLAPEVQAYELGKLEVNRQFAKKTKKVPSAPNPISPVGMGGAGVTEKDPKDMTTEEWMRWDRERTMEKLKSKYGG